jgi:sugar/nucleoside kinase (ribokinase family)
MGMNVWVVGASNVDVIAKCRDKVIAADSNIGTVEKASGGVGRNIACALKAMGFDVSFITAIADDEYGHLVAAELKKRGIKLCSEMLSGPDDRTGVYCCIFDNDGTLVCAVNDMDITQNLTPKMVLKHKAELNASDYVVIDANLPVETIKAIAALDVKLVADCVSTVKALRLNDVLESIFLLKANFFEACALAEVEGVEPDEEGLQTIMEALVAKGLRRAIISLGGKGAFCYEVSGTGTRGYEAPVIDGLEVVSTNGCGDVLLAGFLRTLADGLPMEDAMDYGQMASGINARSMVAVSSELSYELVKKRMEK